MSKEYGRSLRRKLDTVSGTGHRGVCPIDLLIALRIWEHLESQFVSNLIKRCRMQMNTHYYFCILFSLDHKIIILD